MLKLITITKNKLNQSKTTRIHLYAMLTMNDPQLLPPSSVIQLRYARIAARSNAARARPRQQVLEELLNAPLVIKTANAQKNPMKLRTLEQGCLKIAIFSQLLCSRDA